MLKVLDGEACAAKPGVLHQLRALHLCNSDFCFEGKRRVEDNLAQMPAEPGWLRNVHFQILDKYYSCPSSLRFCVPCCSPFFLVDISDVFTAISFLSHTTSYQVDQWHHVHTKHNETERKAGPQCAASPFTGRTGHDQLEELRRC